jgi:hypothetical protein
LRDDKGRPLRGVQKRFDHFLRCHNTNVTHAMNPRLVRLLYAVGRHYPGRRLEVVSGYRHPSVAKNPRSPHMQGLACDFRVSGVKNNDLRDYLRRGYEKVGVGYYPNSSFVHLDVRKDRSAFWIDYSGPGERAIYSEDPTGDLRTGRVNTYKPTKIDKSWVDQPDDRGDDKGGDDDVPPAGAVSHTQPPPGDDDVPARPGAVDGSALGTRPPVQRPTSPLAGTVGLAPAHSGAAEAPQ